jgi:hypothetical protein
MIRGRGGALGHIAIISRPGRAALLAAAFAATVALGGCGGVEFQGKVFDYMGISGDRKQADVHMSERPPLLLPPDVKALPQPGNGVAVATNRADWPQNPEATQKQVIQVQKDQKNKELAEKEPLNPYIGKPTLLDKLFAKDDGGPPVDEVPEPDPSDKPPEGQGVAQAKPKPLTPQAAQEELPNEDLFHPAAPDSYKNPGGALY